MAVGEKHPKVSILVLEKEQEVAQHQTGRNSGVTIQVFIANLEA